MAIFKCKMCGGALEVAEDITVATCEYCGTKQTLPRLDDDRKANMYNRANHFRRNNEFDKAMSLYEAILNENNTDAEAYWSLVLCRYGIEYVEDPATQKRIPTVNRTQYTSIFDNEDYKSALRYADGLQKSVYEAEAHAINEIQKGILEISQKEEPFDVFICYKETDADGKRTPDSVLATELYHELCKEGFKVFFSRITLEDKLGTAYEPYIFAALNSAKVMVVLGTKQEYFNAVWVKNEWSRYLALIKNGAKKVLIPAFRDMDPYDLPDEFSHLQAQDMSKLGFMQDLVRGIKKITAADKPEPTTVKETVITSEAGGNVTALLKRGFLALEDGEWAKADTFFEQCLNHNAELAEAYLGKLMAECKVKTRSDLAGCATPFDGSNNYQKAVRFGDAALVSELEGYRKCANEKSEAKRLEGIYGNALAVMSKATNADEFEHASKLFKSIEGYKNSAELAKQSCEKAYDIVYKSACEILDDSHTWHGKENDIKAHEESIQKFKSINGWRDSEEKILLCQKRIDDAKAKAEADRIESERRAVEARKEAARKGKRQKKIISAAVVAVCAVIVFVIVLNSVIIPNSKYNKALNLLEDGKYGEANSIFYELGDYKDAADKIKETNYLKAVDLAGKGDYANAAICYGKLGDYKDAKEKSFELWGKVAVRDTVSAGDTHTVALKSDGTVVATNYIDTVYSSDDYKGQCDVSGWTDIVAVSGGDGHTVGLKSDGTIVATEYIDDPNTILDDYSGQCDVSGWTDIVAVAAGFSVTVGLKADGTVVTTGYDIVSGWTDIVAVAAGGVHTVGLKSDGTVVTTDDDDVSGWTDIVAVAAGSFHTVGLKSDGTVVAVGDNEEGQCDVSGWTDIVAVAAGRNHTVGLKSDGTVVTTDDDVSGWTDIVAVSAGDYHTIGLKSDGTVVAVGYNGNSQCDVSGWKGIKTP